MYKVFRQSSFLLGKCWYAKGFKNVEKPNFLSITHSNFCNNLCTQIPEDPIGPNIEAIAKGDKDVEHKLKVLTLEVEVMRQEGRLVPDDGFLKEHHWQELLKFPTISARRRYLEYLFKTSKTKENRKLKKEQKSAERLETKPVIKKEEETFEDFVHTYDLSHNNIFLRFFETTMNQMYNNRLIQAMQFGQKLVIDCGYDTNMTPRENKNCAKQIMLLFAENRFHDDPYDLHLCNTNPDSTLMQSLHRHIATLYEPSFPLNVHQASYLELFPKEQLVYLTPHCREELVDYDHDAIYIVGGIVDKINNEPLSLAKAKKENIRMAKFPLERYLQWGAGGGKSLTLNQVTSILLDVKHTGDWKHALRHVPKRKLMDEEEMQAQMSQRHQRRTSWSPKSTNNLDQLGFKNKGSSSYNKDTKRSSRIQIRSILYDD